MVDPSTLQKFTQKLKLRDRDNGLLPGGVRRPPPLQRSTSSPGFDLRAEQEHNNLRIRVNPALKQKRQTMLHPKHINGLVRGYTENNMDPMQERAMSPNSFGSEREEDDLSFKPELGSFPTKNTNMFAFLRKVPILSDLTEEQIQALGESLKHEKYTANEKIITQGEQGTKFYFLLSGKAHCNQRAMKGATEVVRKVNEFSAGDYFGEGALLQEALRMADIVAVENCDCLSLHRNDFHRILGDIQTSLEAQFRARILKGVDLLANLTDEERYVIARDLVVERFKPGEYIIVQGEMGNKFFMIKEGEVLFTRTEEENPETDTASASTEEQQKTPEDKQGDSPKTTKKKKPIEIGRFFSGQCFGEGALLTDAPRRANAVAVGDVTLLTLEREAFSRVINKSLIKTLNDDYTTRVVHSSGNTDLMKFDDLETLLLLGTGTYGKVFLVTHKVTGATYALKSMQKSRIIELNQQEHVKNEKRILSQIQHPFIVDLVQTFVGPNYVYALLEAVLGGELFSLMREAGRFKLRPALFYIAQLVLVLRYLHSQNIVYRDLKPENLMLSSKGYLKMTDFGLAKQLNDGETKTFTLCGTPCYAAPEIYNLSGHSYAVDWWALGVLTHEILSGITPFTGDAESIFATMYAYSRSYPNIKLPDGLSGYAGDFVLRLLHPNARKRLGSRDCKSHKLLRKINWSKIMRQETTAPYVPKIDSLYDTRNFYHKKSNQSERILDEVMDDLKQSEPGKSWDL